MDLNTQSRQLRPQEDHWIPLSDLMSGLMMIFMLIAIVFMIQVKRDEVKILDSQDRIKKIALLYTDLRAQLYQDLDTEFKDDFKKWHASIRNDLSVRFEEPSVQFDTGESVIKPQFASILDSFFPRYAAILTSAKYKDVIEEVRIEGHTSSIWKDKQPEEAYYANMQLSQERTRSVLIYIFSLPKVREQLVWLLPRVTANGLSSARLIYLPNGAQDVVASQRVEFRVRTKAEDRLEEILKALTQ
jgi:outer membrane protein OmpA-like peptidoglycan-associated protein